MGHRFGETMACQVKKMKKVKEKEIFYFIVPCSQQSYFFEMMMMIQDAQGNKSLFLFQQNLNHECLVNICNCYLIKTISTQ